MKTLLFGVLVFCGFVLSMLLCNDSRTPCPDCGGTGEPTPIGKLHGFHDDCELCAGDGHI